MASNFIIDPQSISFEEAKSDIENWLDTRPDSLKWEDYFKASAGQTIIELIAGAMTFSSYQIITGRREAYLPFAENRSSGVAIASQLGYSAFRGANANIKLHMTPLATKTYQKYEVIGSVLDYDLIVLDTTIVNAGTPTYVECVPGFIKTESLTVNSELLQTFRFTSANVSEDFRLYLDGSEIVVTKNLVDLINDQFVQISNALGAFDLFYLNRGALKYTTGDIYDLEFIELAEPEFTINDVKSDEIGITSIEISKVYEEEESLREIKINAPLYNETKFVIKAREDYEKIFTALSTDIITAQGFDFSPAVVQLTYVRENLDMFTEAEKDIFGIELLKARPFGVQPAIITDPVQNNLDLNIQVYLLEKTNEDILAVIDTVLSELEKQLGKTLDLFYIENQIERESYVKNARVKVNAPEWIAENAYSRVIFTTDSGAQNDINFEFQNHIRKSGVAEPDFAALALNGEVTDNEVIWQKREDYRSNFPIWEANKEYLEDDIVVPAVADGYIYVVAATVNKSGLIEPTWPTVLVDTVVDNEVIWRAVNLVGSPAAWAPDATYRIGDVVLPTAGGTMGLQVVKYQSHSDAVEPTWDFTPGYTTDDGKIKWVAREATENVIRINWNEYFLVDKNVTITLQVIV